MPQLPTRCAHIAELKYGDGSYRQARGYGLLRSYLPRCLGVADADRDMRFEATTGMFLHERRYVFDRLLIDF